MEFYKHKENAMRDYEAYKNPGYTVSLSEAPDIDIEFSDNKVLGKSQHLTPL